MQTRHLRRQRTACGISGSRKYWLLIGDTNENEIILTNQIALFVLILAVGGGRVNNNFDNGLRNNLGLGQAFMLGIIGSKQVALGRDIALQLAATLTPRVFLFYLVSKSQDYGQGGAVSE